MCGRLQLYFSLSTYLPGLMFAPIWSPGLYAGIRQNSGFFLFFLLVFYYASTGVDTGDGHGKGIGKVLVHDLSRQRNKEGKTMLSLLSPQVFKREETKTLFVVW